MTDGYEAFELIWCEWVITVGYRANWLNMGHWHLELRCADHLPVTQTGYRSLFLPQDTFASADEIGPYLLSWLDDAANDKAWLRHLEDSRQLKLF